ncbi:uncharacterized protein PV07_12722 [Cladophialophora immunda]|uniref:Uncharacterized protein n=1 Tax=Cladophialophora immunda TaxID=569365 RepID=A0A0D2AAQ6_9EURO|nr:uncharacterized protein PV07_12722 [Cladophialophora immunda]KIW21857.1 hypothetical protein PV07_12722 [Cladophialophora immunda]
MSSQRSPPDYDDFFSQNSILNIFRQCQELCPSLDIGGPGELRALTSSSTELAKDLLQCGKLDYNKPDDDGRIEPGEEPIQEIANFVARYWGPRDIGETRIETNAYQSILNRLEKLSEYEPALGQICRGVTEHLLFECASSPEILENLFRGDTFELCYTSSAYIEYRNRLANDGKDQNAELWYIEDRPTTVMFHIWSETIMTCLRRLKRQLEAIAPTRGRETSSQFLEKMRHLAPYYTKADLARRALLTRIGLPMEYYRQLGNEVFRPEKLPETYRLVKYAASLRVDPLDLTCPFPSASFPTELRMGAATENKWRLNSEYEYISCPLRLRWRDIDHLFCVRHSRHEVVGSVDKDEDAPVAPIEYSDRAAVVSDECLLYIHRLTKGGDEVNGGSFRNETATGCARRVSFTSVPRTYSGGESALLKILGEIRAVVEDYFADKDLPEYVGVDRDGWDSWDLVIFSEG